MNTSHLSGCPRTRTFVRILVSGLCVIVLLRQIGICYERFSKGDTSVHLKIVPTRDITFLALTVCPTLETGFKGRKLIYFLGGKFRSHYWEIAEEELERLGTNRSRYRRMMYETNSSLSPLEVYSLVTYELEDIVEAVHVYTRTMDHPFDLNITEARWITKYSRSRGRCYSLELDRKVIQMGIGAVGFQTKIAVEVHAHYPGHYLDFESKAEVRFGDRSKVMLCLWLWAYDYCLS